MTRFALVLALPLMVLGCSETKLQLSAGDEMRFSESDLFANSGEITIEFRHTGRMSRQSMGHNLVILRPGADVNAFAQAAIGAGEVQRYVPPNHPEVLANTALIGGGETTELTVRLEAGSYTYLCSFPGHSALMRGTLEVM